MGIIKTFLVPRSVEMTDRLMDYLWVPRALTIPSAAVNLNLSQNAANHWTSSAWMYSVDYILITMFSWENNLIARVSFPWLLSDGTWSHQQFVTVVVGKRAIAGCPLRVFPFFYKTFLEPRSYPGWSLVLCLMLSWNVGTFSVADGMYMFFHSDGIPEHLPSALMPLQRETFCARLRPLSGTL